jgi:hypothetical protein
MYLLRRHVEDYVQDCGMMPYSATEPPIADPLALLRPLNGVLPVCTSLAEADGTRLLDTGYRMFNWDRETWALVASHPSWDSHKIAGHDGTPDEWGLRGMPVAWCAQPAHRGMRNVWFVDHPPRGSAPDGLPPPLVRAVNEAEFNGYMKRIEEILAEVRK